MIVCHCRVVSDRVIAAAALRARSVEDIVELCGAGSDCGGCISRIEALVTLPPVELEQAS